ncbi:MAG: hypothetical protein COU07_02865 [Candidatus Harrisonbacteria bacterium CG10_big_fil_rev_8_21_14_0_10_40_38]|uniref:LiaI-LiaF-like transmembrane region domain-containing protein n=1 Tax=Candidatus Harrisonbacteria bacterium CG10_big_fil_rev_8_21_14_0_10_40_38 TaxID=1974583 RepID=A0A2H0URZ0_9BACT|nr:MAG: hypothetical protein COU07_02865 [Candidatus Harrisonbacteria bacterium CG10_big_fil_rev_8_21_14_0_10_40_38]
MNHETEEKNNAGHNHEEKIVKEIHHHYSKDSTNFGKIFLGLAIVTIGLLLLGRNFGFLPNDFSVEIGDLWPFLIIVAGLSMFSGRGFLGNLIGFLIMIFVLALFLFVLFGGFTGGFDQSFFDGSVFSGTIIPFS